MVRYKVGQNRATLEFDDWSLALVANGPEVL